MGGIFGVGKILNIFLGFLKFLIFFGVIDAGSEPMYEEKLRVAPLSGTIKPVRKQFVRVHLYIPMD